MSTKRPPKPPCSSGNGNAQPAELGDALPHLRVPASRCLPQLAEALHARVVGHELGHGVDDDLLLFGEIEVDVPSSPSYAVGSRRMCLATMFFWISLEPP